MEGRACRGLPAEAKEALTDYADPVRGVFFYWPRCVGFLTRLLLVASRRGIHTLLYHGTRFRKESRALCGAGLWSGAAREVDGAVGGIVFFSFAHPALCPLPILLSRYCVLRNNVLSCFEVDGSKATSSLITDGDEGAGGGLVSSLSRSARKSTGSAGSPPPAAAASAASKHARTSSRQVDGMCREASCRDGVHGACAGQAVRVCLWCRMRRLSVLSTKCVSVCVRVWLWRRPASMAKDISVIGNSTYTGSKILKVRMLFPGHSTGTACFALWL